MIFLWQAICKQCWRACGLSTKEVALNVQDADTDSLAQSLPLPSSLDKPNDCPEPVDSVSQLPVHGHAKLAILADDASGSSTLPCIERAGASEEICIPSDAQVCRDAC